MDVEWHRAEKHDVWRAARQAGDSSWGGIEGIEWTQGKLGGYGRKQNTGGNGMVYYKLVTLGRVNCCWFPIHSRGVASQRIDGSGVPTCPVFSLFGLLASLIKYLKYGYNRISRILYFIVLLFEKSVHRK